MKSYKGKRKWVLYSQVFVGPIAILINKYFRKSALKKSGRTIEFDSHVMQYTEEIDENVVREGLVRLLKKRHEEYEIFEKAKRRSSLSKS